MSFSTAVPGTQEGLSKWDSGCFLKMLTSVSLEVPKQKRMGLEEKHDTV